MGVGVMMPCICCTTVYNIMYTVHHKIKTLHRVENWHVGQ